MSGPVDVRKDLNSIASLLEQLRQNNAAIMLDRVSVAVAELIEVASLRVYNVNQRWYVVHNDQPKTAWSNIPHISENEAAREKDEALKAALANVGSAS